MAIGVANILRRRPLYLRAFLDFRGRLYRRSILSPQSSSLARALMVFDHTAPVNCSNAHLFASHIGFAFKRFVTFAESSQWVTQNIRQIIDLHQKFFYMEDGNERIDLACLEEPWRALSISLLLKEHLIPTNSSLTVAIFNKQFQDGYTMSSSKMGNSERVPEKLIRSFVVRRVGNCLVAYQPPDGHRCLLSGRQGSTTSVLASLFILMPRRAPFRYSGCLQGILGYVGNAT